MLGQMDSAEFTNSQVIITLNTSTANAYGNTVRQYSPWGILSVPLATQLVNLDMQCSSQVMATGYNNQITDEEFSINPGEISNFSSNWYNFTANSGIYMQPVGQSNKENAIMGQSTNSVLSDILGIIISVITYLDAHVHTGVQTGGDNSGPPLNPAPDDSTISNDKIYIDANHNLAITGTYQPK